ncbi:hypothetical protein N9242_00995 [Vicingaceae bacterium]|nr:hypothetical protein [Vicingaceae bacterium]
MKDFIENRNAHILSRKVLIVNDVYNDKSKLEAMFNILSNRSLEMDTSIEFLENNIEEIEKSVNDIIESLHNKVSYLKASVVTLNRLKLEHPSTSKEGDIELVNLSDGSYTDVSYSYTDDGIVMNTVSSTTFRDK